jgi:cell division protein ZapA (FtsZ GTPase activity inhibitor)
MRTIQITVAGHTFSIKSDTSEDHMAVLAKEVDQRFRSLKGKGGTRGDQDLLIMSMVAVALLDELRSSELKSQEIQNVAADFASQIIEKIDELLVQEVV